MSNQVYIVIEADGYYGDWTSVLRQCQTRAAAEKFIGHSEGYRILPIDADFAGSYTKHRRVHREDVRRIAQQVG